MSKELGTLVVVVLKAKNLHDKHSLYKQDVFAQIAIESATKKTRVDVKGGQHPVWDEELRFAISVSAENRILEVTCWSKEPRKEELLGRGELDISETLRTGEFDDWIPLHIDGGYRGDVYLEMTFYAAGPAPSLSRRPTKLNPSDRLARSSHTYSYTHTLPAGTPLQSSPQYLEPVSSSAGSKFVPPPSLRPASSSPHGRDSPLPPLPEEHDSKAEHVPSILRPGNAKTSPRTSPRAAPPVLPNDPHYRPTPVHNSPPHPPAHALVPNVYPPPQLRTGVAYNTEYIHSSPPTAIAQHTLPPSQAGSTLFFPAQSVTSQSVNYDVPQEFLPPIPGGSYPHRYQQPQFEPDIDLPDPFLTTRYTSPLPLPKESQGAQKVNVNYPRATIPGPSATTTSQSHTNGKVGVREAKASAPKRSHAVSRSRDEDRGRTLAVAAEHEKERRRKQLAEQEAQDLELAKKLDLELNLPGSGSADGGGESNPNDREDEQRGSMPGTWH